MQSQLRRLEGVSRLVRVCARMKDFKKVFVSFSKDIFTPLSLRPIDVNISVTEKNL